VRQTYKYRSPERQEWTTITHVADFKADCGYWFGRIDAVHAGEHELTFTVEIDDQAAEGVQRRTHERLSSLEPHVVRFTVWPGPVESVRAQIEDAPRAGLMLGQPFAMIVTAQDEVHCVREVC
jgi:hypothetical protein